MARIDQLMVHHRALCGTALTGILGVRVNSGGSVVPSGTATGEGAQAIICHPGTTAAGKPIAIVKRGEIVEFGGSPGTNYYAGVGGSIGTTSTNATLVGHTIEGDRLVVTL